MIMNLGQNSINCKISRKWLFYEKYLVLDHDLKLKYYSYYPNLISGS